MLTILPPSGDSFFVSDEIGNAVSQFRLSNGDFQRVLITGVSPPGHPGTPNGIVVNPVSRADLVVAFQNADTPFNGEIRVFDKATGAFTFALVQDADPGAPCAPFGILLYDRGARNGGTARRGVEGYQPQKKQPDHFVAHRTGGHPR